MVLIVASFLLKVCYMVRLGKMWQAGFTCWMWAENTDGKIWLPTCVEGTLQIHHWYRCLHPLCRLGIHPLIDVGVEECIISHIVGYEEVFCLRSSRLICEKILEHLKFQYYQYIFLSSVEYCWVRTPINALLLLKRVYILLMRVVFSDPEREYGIWGCWRGSWLTWLRW